MKKFLLLIIITAGVVPLLSQETPLLDEFRTNFQKESFRIGALVQIVGDFQTERTMPGNNGFSIANMRLNLSGTLDEGFSYFLQTNFLNAPSILDAYMSYAPLHAMTVDAGLLKVPFSKEYLTSAADIDFVNRSQSVDAMTLGRQAGVQVRGGFENGMIRYRAGVFNGNTGFAGNDNNDFLVAGRVSLFPFEQKSGQTLEIGINGGRSHDNGVLVLGTPFTGVRTIAGADGRWTAGRVLLAAEYVATEYRVAGTGAKMPEGFYFTAGYMITDKSQILVRYDNFRSHGIGTDSDLFLAGYNLWPTAVTEIQVNIVVPRFNTAVNKPQLLLNTQVSL